ncbi:RICIN domain-containing protein [Winogradskya humida]|uniref:Ricin B lectin domain-containing protein n=1 Tax=Winogradskya humida TaxID=113566 RepID=A0ABQ3ZI04_9ACTN|nr:RICIN domain-containing protein [Actinoplanes humidus]GIE18216.1 hypothetical protein Ahu01nite_013180 [Actinoplanes humidus]
MFRVRRILVLLAVFLAVTSLVGVPAQAAGDEAANVKIQNLESRLCLTPAGSSGALNATIVQYLCQADPSRSYTIHFDSARQSYQIWNMKNDLCLSPAGGSVGLNVVIVQYTCDSDWARHWYVVKQAGIWSLRNAKSDLCLSPAGGSTALNATIVQYYCDGNRSRTWDWYTAEFYQNLNAGHLCVTIAGGSAAPNAPAVTYTCDGQPARLWKWMPTPHPYTFQIMNVSTGFCLSPAGGDRLPGVPIVQYYCDGQPGRQWARGELGGRYSILNSGGFCLAVANDGTGLNNALTLEECTRTPSRTWSVYLG